MVFPLILLKESRRKIISEAASILHFLAFLIAISLFLCNSVFHLLTSDSLVILISKQSAFTGWIPLIVAILAAFTAVLHLWLWIYVKDQRHRHSRWKTSAIREAAILLVTFSIFLTLASSILHGFYRFNFEKYLSLGFFEGMLQSNVTASIKYAIDKIQIENRCCGINHLQDWVNMSQIDLNGGQSDYIKEGKTWGHCNLLPTNNSHQQCYIPFSCCRSEQFFCTPWANFVASESTAFTEEFFHTDGCIPILSCHPFAWIQFGILGLLLVVEIIGGILTQFIASSTYVIEQIGAEEDTIIPAWILPFGKYSSKHIVEHTLACFARYVEFDYATLKETYQKSQLLKQQQNVAKPLPNTIYIVQSLNVIHEPSHAFASNMAENESDEEESEPGEEDEDIEENESDEQSEVNAMVELEEEDYDDEEQYEDYEDEPIVPVTMNLIKDNVESLMEHVDPVASRIYGLLIERLSNKLLLHFHMVGLGSIFLNPLKIEGAAGTFQLAVATVVIKKLKETFPFVFVTSKDPLHLPIEIEYLKSKNIFVFEEEPFEKEANYFSIAAEEVKHPNPILICYMIHFPPQAFEKFLEAFWDPKLLSQIIFVGTVYSLEQLVNRITGKIEFKRTYPFVQLIEHIPLGFPQITYIYKNGLLQRHENLSYGVNHSIVHLSSQFLMQMLKT